MELDNTLCFCFHIRKRKIVNFVKRTRPKRASQISECFGAGTGCGWCIPFLKRLHRQIVAGDIVEAEDIGAAEYEAMRRRYLAGIEEGTRERNTLAMEGPPPELDAERAKAWDVSDYFSKAPAPEPGPDDLAPPAR
jgi:NAD(P)H-nitrite reductase large subunit